MEIQGWLYQGKTIKEAPSGYYGFIYKITDDQGRVYFGKKAFIHNTKKAISKKVRKATKTRKRVERVKKDSGWLDYWGSSKPFIEYLDSIPNAKEYSKREIVKLCKTKIDLNYWEVAILIKENVIFRYDCWNLCIGGKYWKGKVNL